jgi:hypothetical protein
MAQPLIIPLRQFFLKIVEIFAAQGAPPVSNEKNLQSEKFSLYLLDTFG